MKFKRIIYGICKVLSAGLVAGIILTAFCFLYYNVPVHVKCEDKTTDYVWEKNKFYSRGTEGFAMGKTNNEGYMNRYDYNKSNNIEVLIIGSSHMEAYQVAKNESTASRLDDMLGGKKVYNIGTSAHDMMVCITNYNDALKKYKPSKYVVIETDSIRFNKTRIKNIIDGNYKELESYNGGIVGLLQRNPYLRLLYKQLKGTNNEGEDVVNNTPSEMDMIGMTEEEKVLWDKIIERISKESNKYGVKTIIMYHPTIQLKEDGSLLVNKDYSYTESYNDICKKYGIELLDMTNRFIVEYDNNKVLPYGFINSSVGVGHLNKYGHAMVAEELYDLISKEK